MYVLLFSPGQHIFLVLVKIRRHQHLECFFKLNFNCASSQLKQELIENIIVIGEILLFPFYAPAIRTGKKFNSSDKRPLYAVVKIGTEFLDLISAVQVPKDNCNQWERVAPGKNHKLKKNQLISTVNFRVIKSGWVDANYDRVVSLSFPHFLILFVYLPLKKRGVIIFIIDGIKRKCKVSLEVTANFIPYKAPWFTAV